MHSTLLDKPVWEEKVVEGIPYLSCPKLEEIPFIKHGFSTRKGGVSEGIFDSMNLSFTRGDEDEAVRENFRRMALAIGVAEDSLVFAKQTHTTNVKVVTEEDKGKGIIKELDYDDIDGLITNIPGVTLVTFFADCVPLYFLDTKNKAIGLSHSGWRGTVHRMGQETLLRMREAFGTDPADVVACIGPSICQDCYEVGPEVIEQFRNAFAECHHENLFYEKPNGKFQLNLWKANRIVLSEAGIPKSQISVTDICTYCNSYLSPCLSM